MPVCYFENDHHKKYKCSYEISVYFEHYLPEESLCTFRILY